MTLGDTVRGKNMFLEDMRTEKINFTCEPEDKEYLRIWAAKEGRTLSNLVERVMKDAIIKHQEENQVKDTSLPIKKVNKN